MLRLSFASINVNYNDDTRGKCRWWWVYNQRWGDFYHPESGAVGCSLTTEDILDLDISTGFETRLITDLLRKSLGKAYDQPIDADCTRTFDLDLNAPSTLGSGKCQYRVFPNKDNELWYGSYENWNPGGTAADFEEFIAPLGNKVHFAGSGTCRFFWGFIHGAYYGGIKALKEAYPGIESEIPPEFCEANSFGRATPRCPRGG